MSKGVLPQPDWYLDDGYLQDPSDPSATYFNGHPIHDATKLALLCRAAIEALCFQIECALARDAKDVAGMFLLSPSVLLSESLLISAFP